MSKKIQIKKITRNYKKIKLEKCKKKIQIKKNYQKLQKNKIKKM